MYSLLEYIFYIFVLRLYSASILASLKSVPNNAQLKLHYHAQGNKKSCCKILTWLEDTYIENTYNSDADRSDLMISYQ